MDKFEYRAKDQDGQIKKGVVEAISEKGAAKLLKEKGFWIISLKAKGKSFSADFKAGIFKRVTATDRVNFTRQLSTMITAGLPITEALSILESQAGPSMAVIVGEVLRGVESGQSLSQSLEKHPEAFNHIYVSLVKAGESAGVLDKILVRLADNLEKNREFNNKIKSAMVYPLVVVVGMFGVGIVMMVFVIPKMLAIYDEFQAKLPASTRALITVSQFFTRYWWTGIFVLAGLFFLWRAMSKKPEVKKYFDRIIFRLPIIGKLRKQIILTEFARTLGLLVGAGILIVEALQIVAKSLGSSIFEKAVRESSQEVEKGLPLATALARTEVFPVIMPQMIAVGEETGKLDEVLGKISSYFEQEADMAVKGLTSALEPVIMIVLGIGVGFLIISVIMPIYSLTSQF